MKKYKGLIETLIITVAFNGFVCWMFLDWLMFGY